MSQNASPNSILNDSRSHFTSTPDAARGLTSQFPADGYADRLMDDLFQEVEQLLDGQPSRVNTGRLSQTPPEPLPTSAPVFVDESHLVAITPVAEPEMATVKDDRALAGVEPLAVFPDPATVAVQPEAPPERSHDRLLLAVGCISVVVSLALWLLHQDSKHQKPVAAVVPGQAIAAADAQTQFADYAQKALRAIEQRSPQSTPVQPTPETAATGTAAGPGMPTVTIPKTTTPGTLTPNRTTTGLERIYVPVYQIPTNLYPPGTPSALPSPAATSKPIAPVVVRPKPATASVSGISRKLVGVLNQGERSVALFEVGSVTKRYEIGESIGSSGWTLVEVTKDQAIIRRNGEVRSLFVGHGF